jgi:hypothetical protein
MFTWLNKQGVKSSDGFIVQSVARFTIEYRENSKCMSVEVDNGRLPNGKFCEIVKSSAFSKWDDGTPISEEKQKEILKNFTDAMEFQDIGVVVE